MVFFGGKQIGFFGFEKKRECGSGIMEVVVDVAVVVIAVVAVTIAATVIF